MRLGVGIDLSNVQAVFSQWLAVQRQHEADHVGVDHRALACNPKDLTEHVIRRLGSTQSDVMSIAALPPWSYVSDAEQREHWENVRHKYIDGLTSALEGIASLLVAVGCTDAELAGRYTRLLQLTVDEFVSQVDEFTCPVCGKSTEGFGCFTSSPATGGVLLCGKACFDAYGDAKVVRVVTPISDVTSATEDLVK